LSETAAAHVYRIVQEALTNAMRHSGAREVSIRLKTSDGELHLRVSDDGHGFGHFPADGPGGLGLKIMRYRAQMLGGDLVIETNGSGGTSVSCSCPLDLTVEPE
jgi:signal transduction histidine kinase